jgi:alginate O-acetyltransferase complex protein AlgJ
MSDRTITRADAVGDDAEIHEGDEATIADALEEPAADDRAGIKPEGLVSPHRARVVAVPLVAALLFFFGPAVAFLLCDRAEEIDNRPLADTPSPLQGWSFIPDFNTWANDHLPLRSQAVRGGTELSEKVFDEPPQYGQTTAADGVRTPAVDGAQTTAVGGAQTTPGDGVQYPRVIRGSDGWLYLGSDVSTSCNPLLSVRETVRSLQRLDAAIEGSGRTLVLAVAPDKSTIVPEHLPDRFAGEGCAKARKAAFWDSLTSAGLPLIDMRGPLQDAQERLGHPVYRKTDSHWNWQGASVLAEQVVTRLDPALLAGDASPFVEGRETELRGDLGAMIGKPSTDEAVEVTVDRPGVTLSVGGQTVDASGMPGLGTQPATIDASSTAAPLYPGRTAVFGDSFFGSARAMFAPFFDELSIVHNQSPARVLAKVIADSDTIVVELVERSVAGGAVQFATPAVVDVIERELADSPR